MKNSLWQGGEAEQVSFSIAFPPPQRELAQLWPLFESIHDRMDVRYAVPQLGVQLPSGTQLVHAHATKKVSRWKTRLGEYKW